MYCISENCRKILLKEIICPASTWAVSLLCFVCIGFISRKRREKSEARFAISVWRHRRDLNMHVSHYLRPAPESLQIWKRFSMEQLQAKVQFWKWKVTCCLRGDTAMRSRCVTECERNFTNYVSINSKTSQPLPWPWPTVNSRLNVLDKIRRDYEEH